MLIALHKPFDVLCQFTDPLGRITLANYVNIPNVYAAGRLDRDSEGLLLLTDDGRLAQRISNPRHAWPKTYWAQVEGLPDAPAIAQLCKGVRLNDGPTKPAQVSLLDEAPPGVWPRNPPIRFRAAIPTHWLQLILREGRNRQVRRMTAAVGLPTLRLIRAAIGPIALADLQPGDWREVNSAQKLL